MNDGSIVMKVYLIGMLIKICIEIVWLKFEKKELDMWNVICRSALWPAFLIIFLSFMIVYYVKEKKK